MDFLLNRRIVLYGVGGVTLAVLVVALARVFRDILTVLLLIIILALVVVVVLMWLKQRKAAQGSAEIESTIVRQADRDIERSIPAQAADLQNMKADLLAAIEALKSSKGGGGALATLPWYLVMGAKGAGKGTLVQNSGLNFPLKDAAGRGPRSVKGVGGTRSLEWWLSEEAVLLEVPGGLLRDSQFEDTDDWIAFLGVLRKQRPARPINGVIVPISVDQVAETPAADVEKFARRVRERVLELNHHLGVTFPTYIVLTGCDRIAGFTEFFAGLDAAKRGQAWGATVPVAQALERPAEELFDAEFQTLTGTLARRWVGTLGGLEDDEQRTRAFAFPLQLERMRPTLRLLVRTLYDAGGPGERPLFRGFYLTSAAPSGAAVDRVYGPAAIALGLNAGAASAPTPAAGGSWFVSDLFTKVIFPDRDMVTESTQRVERRRLARVMLAASLGLVLLVLLAFFAVVSVMNGDPIDHVR
ncbi:MAG TPA: type VI secretion protein IcmF/TssM N-terminal domain-containing protein, partial [Candidatus Eisenbacteria bacterium]